MRDSAQKAKLAGACPNPLCDVLETKTSGLTTDETRGLPRLNRRKGGCSRCLQEGKKRKNEKFQWTPDLLKEAVDYAMQRLDDVA